VVSSKPLADSI